MSARTLSDKPSFTQGPIAPAIIRFALPVFGALVLQAAYGAVDLLVIGMFGDAASISAVGTGSAFMSMVTFIMSDLAMGATVTIAQHIGAKKAKEAGNTVGTTIIFFAIVSIIFTVLLEVFAGNIVSIMQTPAEAVAKTTTYLRICFGGIAVIIAYNLISSILRGIGNARLPLLFVGIACVVNIIGDFVLVGAFGMDVAGAAIATVFAQLVSVILSVFVLRRSSIGVTVSKKQLKIYKDELHSILKIGLPIALQNVTVQGSFLVINSIINSMGLDQSAGYGVASKVITFIMLVPSAVTQSVSAFVAQNIGASQEKRARSGFYIAIIGSSIIGIVMFCIGCFGGSLVSRIFTDDPAVIAQSADFLRGFSGECILTCTIFSCIGYFNGSGKTIPVMLQGILSALLIRIPVALYMSRLPVTSLIMVGLSAPISSAFGIIFFIGCFIYMNNNQKKILKRKI